MEATTIVDLRSDTVTKPSPGMREAMAQAEVGDDVYGEDPTVNRLEARAAELMGKEAAVFVPTGTMANLIAFLSQTRPGDTVILSEGAHPFHYENANLAMIGGLLTRTIADPFCKITADQVAAQIVQKDDPHFSPTTLAAIENTTNRGGGACYRIDEIEAIGQLCKRRGLRLHCDGARIFNAAAATNIDAQYLIRPCDTVSFCLSKGLGAPAGSLLCGTRDTIHLARRFRKMLGGGMRQVGILAAAGLYAIEHHIEDIAEDHRRARQFRTALEAAGIVFCLPSPTNIVYIAMENPEAGVAKLREQGVLVLAHGADRVRAVFHRDVTDEHLARAIEVFKKNLAPA
jgi:threonine aldolase